MYVCVSMCICDTEFENYFQKSKFLGFNILTSSNINFKENSPAKHISMGGLWICEWIKTHWYNWQTAYSLLKWMKHGEA